MNIYLNIIIFAIMTTKIHSACKVKTTTPAISTSQLKCADYGNCTIADCEYITGSICSDIFRHQFDAKCNCRRIKNECELSGNCTVAECEKFYEYRCNEFVGLEFDSYCTCKKAKKDCRDYGNCTVADCNVLVGWLCDVVGFQYDANCKCLKPEKACEYYENCNKEYCIENYFSCYEEGFDFDGGCNCIPTEDNCEYYGTCNPLECAKIKGYSCDYNHYKGNVLVGSSYFDSSCYCHFDIVSCEMADNCDKEYCENAHGFCNGEYNTGCDCIPTGSGFPIN